MTAAYEGWLPFIREYLTPKAFFKLFPGWKVVGAIVSLVDAQNLVRYRTWQGVPRTDGGWFIKCDSGIRPHEAYRDEFATRSSAALAQSYSGVNCGLPLQVPDGQWDAGQLLDKPAMLNTSVWQVGEIWLGPDNVAGTRFDVEMIWKFIKNPNTGAEPASKFNPARALGVALPTPVPMPYWLIPYRNHPSYRDLGDGLLTPARGPAPSVKSATGTRPAMPRSPPPKGTKEIKLKLTPAGRSWVGLLLHGVTETLDFIDAIYYALPGRRPGGLTPQEKLVVIYQRFRDIDVNKLMENLIVNQIIDSTLGSVGRAMTKAQRRAYVERYLNRMNLAAGPAL